MRDPTLADQVLAGLFIAWALFVVFGGLAVLGWWFGGLLTIEPRRRLRLLSERHHSPAHPVTTGFSVRAGPPGEYIVYDDPDSTIQVLEDDRQWHHDLRRAQGHTVCPECGSGLGPER